VSEINQELELDLEAPSGLERRRFLRNAAVAGVTAAWSAPLIQTVAYATGGHHPPPGSPFTPGECPRTDGRTTTGDTKSKESHHTTNNHTKDNSDNSHGNSRDNSKDWWDD
jgi:hypothetical protein